MPQAKRSEPVRVPYLFDEAMQRALRVKPPPGGWKKATTKLRSVRRRRAVTKKK